MAKNANAITQETIAMLDGDVKKKKPRKFFFVYKGSQIKSLVVFKKGPFGPKIMKAKKDGHLGEICYGIVVGAGEKLTFMLPRTSEVAAAMKVDGWEAEAPIEKAKLKKFMKESGYPCKPIFEMVNRVDDALDPEADGVAPSSAEAESNAGAPGTADVSAAQTQLSNALRALAEKIRTAAAADPARKQEIIQCASDVQRLISAGEVASAKERLDDLEGILQAVLDQAGDEAESLLRLWRDAKDLVDKQLEGFRSAMLKTGDPYLTKIAKAGIETFLVGKGQEFVTLQTALLELQKAQGDARRQVANKLLNDIASYRDYVAANQFIKVCDTNRLYGPLNIGDTLAAALSQLEQSAKQLAA